MAWIKVFKNSSYFSRFQVPRRRRVEGKTNFKNRLRLVKQAKNKQNTPRQRLVVRLTNQRVITQVVWSTLTGDRVLESADSFELKNQGMTAGLKNQSAAQLTGQLLGRRLLTKQKLADTYKGNTAVDGKAQDVMKEQEALEAKGQANLRKPFRCFLDVGLTRITTGNKVFGAMKGAVDAGVHVPHSVKKFPGFKRVKGNKKGEYDAEAHSARITGGHVDAYWGELEESNEAKAKAHFAKWQACLDKAGVESIPDLFQKVVAAIRKDSGRKKVAKKCDKPKRDGDWITSNGKKWERKRKLTKDQKREVVKTRIAEAANKFRESRKD